MEVFNLIKGGGFIMWPLLLCSILVWAVALEKFYSLWFFRKKHNELHALLIDLVKDKKMNESIGASRNAHPLLTNIYAAVLVKEPDVDTWEQKIGRRLSETQQGLRKFLWLLGTIGNAAPFIGLFGTVVGIIKSFESMASSGKSGFNVVAQGLSEALIATAAGIIVAVISVVFFNYFQTRLQSLNLELKNKIEDLMDVVKSL